MAPLMTAAALEPTKLVPEIDELSNWQDGDVSELPVALVGGSAAAPQAEEERHTGVAVGWADDLREVLAVAREHLEGELTPAQAAWCSPDRIAIYLRARQGDVQRAGEILAQALQVRHEKEDILTGRRTPCWVGDLRVLSRSEDGHPLIYTCFANQVHGCASSDLEDHVAAVFESAMCSTRHGARQTDIVVDCHGFRLSANLDPRPARRVVGMLKNPFRDCLHTVVILDAPPTFVALYNAAKSAVSPELLDRVVFLPGEEAEAFLAEHMDGAVAAKVQEAMLRNRGDSEGSGGAEAPPCLPSELQVDEGCRGGAAVAAGQPAAEEEEENPVCEAGDEVQQVEAEEEENPVVEVVLESWCRPPPTYGLPPPLRARRGLCRGRTSCTGRQDSCQPTEKIRGIGRDEFINLLSFRQGGKATRVWAPAVMHVSSLLPRGSR